MSSPAPTPVDAAIQAYDRLYRERGMRSQRMYPNEALIQFLAARYFGLPLEQRAAIRILEVGCGSGANLWMMRKEGFETHGIDSSAEGLELARVHLRDKWQVSADLKTGSFTALPYANEQFDAVVDVVSLEVLALNDSRVALREIARCLKPGGAFFSYRLSDHSTMFEGPDARIDSATLANIADQSMPLSNNGPLSFWSPALTRELYSAAQLDVESIERVGRTYTSGVFVEYLKIVATRGA
ncbi:MAG: class I SAM-dependent methyltransferase [Pseudomonadota bacterium]